MKKILLLCLLSLSLLASGGNVYKSVFHAPMDEVYENVMIQFQVEKLVVVWELDILEEFKKKGLDKKFGKNFNTSGLTSVKTFVACNGKVGNAVMNADADMMAYCPIRITLTEKDGVTSVLYVRPTSAPKDSKAYVELEKLEKQVIKAIEDSMLED